MLRNLKSFNLPEVEEKVIQFWKEKNIVAKALFDSKGKKKTFVFWEGPPSANGRPGIHHMLSRVVKDVFLRFRAMEGFFVPRKAGWDAHGLPVEIEAEKALGLSSKKDIEKFGIREFNLKAKEIVFKYKDEWEKITERTGFWLDLKNPYITYDNRFIESLWWVFSTLYKKGFLKESYKVNPYCPRCQTGLASHELGQPGVYRTVEDNSVYLKLPLKGKKNENLLVWTTTPWTLPANVAVAVKPAALYEKFKIGDEYFWALRLPSILSALATGEKITGKDMVGWKYIAPYPFRKTPHLPFECHQVLTADFVSVEDGTGMVHIAPTFGEDDFSLVTSKGKNFSILETLLPDGTMAKGVIGEGKFFKEADLLIIADLEKRGFLLAKEKISHEYPFCWRCSSPLVYFARRAWFFEMSRLRRELKKANDSVNWVPGHIKEGRFGEWIGQAKDWAISRERYWGTPLPIWKCDKCDELTVAGCLDDLNTHRQNPSATFFLMRHGQARANVEKWIASGKEDGKWISRLTDKGKKDAEKCIGELKKKNIDFIFCSPYERAKETARIISSLIGVKVIIDKRLSEIQLGALNRKPVSTYEEFYKKAEDRFTSAPEKGESLVQVRRRMYDFVREINGKHPGKNILVVSHGDPLWMMEASLKHISFSEAMFLSNFKTGEMRCFISDNFPVDGEGNLDLHRPFVDEIKLSCKKCGGIARRVSEVADVWFDSGAMPYANIHWPFSQNQKSPISLSQNRERAKTKNQKFPEAFPADFISEGIDQTRGWFYTLMAVSVMLGFGAPYRNVVSLGLLLDKNGQKMSKSKGNVVDPWSMIQKYGADAMRWYFYTVNDPGDSKNFNETDILKASRKFLLLFYNSFAFFDLYGVYGISIEKPPETKNVLDIWILARLSETLLNAKKSMENYDVLKAAVALQDLCDDLSRWYIRRSRRRFQKPESQRDLKEASQVLGFVLLSLSKAAAPFVPFFAESVYQSLKKIGKFAAKESVHLENFPQYLISPKKRVILPRMAAARDIASKILARRAEEKIKIRQPLAKLTMRDSVLAKEKGIISILKGEVNVKEVKVDKTLKEEFLLDTILTPELKAEGILRECLRLIQDLRQEAGFAPKDRIALYLKTERNLETLLKSNAVFIRKEVNAVSLEFKKAFKYDAEINTKFENVPFYAAVKKTK